MQTMVEIAKPNLLLLSFSALFSFTNIQLFLPCKYHMLFCNLFLSQGLPIVGYSQTLLKEPITFPAIEGFLSLSLSPQLGRLCPPASGSEKQDGGGGAAAA